MSVESSPFGVTNDGQSITAFTCQNANGLGLKMIELGAIVMSVDVPDSAGNQTNINLGFDELAGYEQRHPYFGSTVGRYGNRLALGRFTLDGDEYRLAANDGTHHLHGGIRGFDRAIWKGQPIRRDDAVGVQFHHLSPDGEEGYPGNLTVAATYLLTNNDALRIEFSATTDKPTPVNLTNHNYWNLTGAGQGSITDHVVTIHASRYLPVDDSSIPTGELADVAGTVMDFREPKRIGQQLFEIGNEPVGYDHCYVLDRTDASLQLAAKVEEPKSGRTLEVWTTEPGVQFYTGNYLDGSSECGGHAQHEAFCLETQHFPDSPNQPQFPSTILRPGETYRHVTEYRFSILP